VSRQTALQGGRFAETDKDFLVRAYRDMGYECFAEKLNSADSQSVQQRNRWYLVFVLAAPGPVQGDRDFVPEWVLDFIRWGRGRGTSTGRDLHHCCHTGPCRGNSLPQSSPRQHDIVRCGVAPSIV
jgi:hypothetical protein